MSLIPFDAFPVIGAGVAVITALLSAVTAAVGRRIGSKSAGEPKEASRDYKSEIRLTLVGALLAREVARRKVFSLASGLLIFSQFVVGGVLASSFVIRALGENLIGLFGLVVLLSSLINQQFRPDLLRRTSCDKLRRLRSLKRKLEDELYIATRGEIADAELIRLRLYTTNALEQIEEEESHLLDREKDT